MSDPPTDPIEFRDPSMTREQVRAVDRIAIERFHIPGVVLMENAGRGVVDWMCSLGITGPVAICCGKGNNAGDGFVIARHLENRGHDVRVLLFCDPLELQGDAAINFRIFEAARTPIRVMTGDSSMDRLGDAFNGCDWIVDALLGTGIRGEVRGAFPEIITVINQTDARVMAVDLPSGMDCDTGEPLGCCVRADCTTTFVARKLGFENSDSLQFTGEVRVMDIGVPRAVLDAVWAER